MSYFRKFFVYVMGFLFISTSLYAETEDLKLLDWEPKSQLVVKESRILKPKYPAIDIHNHLRNLENTKKYLEEMDKAGVWKCVSLDANSKDDFIKNTFVFLKVFLRIGLYSSFDLISV